MPNFGSLLTYCLVSIKLTDWLKAVQMGRFQDVDSYFDSYFKLEISGMPLPRNFTYSSTLTDVRLPLSLVWGAKRTWRKPSHPLPSTQNMKERGQPHPQK